MTYFPRAVPDRGRRGRRDTRHPEGQAFSEEELDAAAPMTVAEVKSIAVNNPTPLAKAHFEARIAIARRFKYG